MAASGFLGPEDSPGAACTPAIDRLSRSRRPSDAAAMAAIADVSNAASRSRPREFLHRDARPVGPTAHSAAGGALPCPSLSPARGATPAPLRPRTRVPLVWAFRCDAYRGGTASQAASLRWPRTESAWRRAPGVPGMEPSPVQAAARHTARPRA